MSTASPAPATAPARPEVLEGVRWRALACAHAAAAAELTAGHRARRAAGRSHPVEDFLFTYYRLGPLRLERWHPGVGPVLQDADERSDWRGYRRVGETGVTVDGPAAVAAAGATVPFLRRLLTASRAATPQFGCFGLHEWAMVFDETAERRHPGWSLRLGRAGTDEVVRTHRVRCSHFDAHRFFAPAARPRNELQPTLADRADQEQPGCLHATMDLYKWAYKLGPLVPGELLLDCFRLARDVREVDMRASPYDLSALGYAPIAIETAEGKAEYVAAQRDFAMRGQLLRGRLIDTLVTVGE